MPHVYCQYRRMASARALRGQAATMDLNCTELVGEVGCECRFSSGELRHSWATAHLGVEALDALGFGENHTVVILEGVGNGGEGGKMWGGEDHPCAWLGGAVTVLHAGQQAQHSGVVLRG